MVAFADVRHACDGFDVKSARFEHVFVQVSDAVFPSARRCGNVEAFDEGGRRVPSSSSTNGRKREDDGEDEEASVWFEKIPDVRKHGERTVTSVEDVEHADAIEFSSAECFVSFCFFFFQKPRAPSSLPPRSSYSSFPLLPIYFVLELFQTFSIVPVSNTVQSSCDSAHRFTIDGLVSVATTVPKYSPNLLATSPSPDRYLNTPRSLTKSSSCHHRLLLSDAFQLKSTRVPGSTRTSSLVR